MAFICDVRAQAERIQKRRLRELTDIRNRGSKGPEIMLTLHAPKIMFRITTDPINAIVSSAATRGPAATRGAELAVCALVLDVEASEAAVVEVVVEGLVGRLVALIPFLVLGPEVVP